MEEIAEQIIEKVEGMPIKDTEMYEYIDKRIDDWEIETGDYYLDDIVEYILKILKKRRSFETESKKHDDIVFKMDEETAEQHQLEMVVKKYNKLYKSACNIVTIDVVICESIVTGESTTVTATNDSWIETLDRIDNIYKKLKN